MKAVIYTEYGSPEVLELKELDKPTVKDDEVLIRIYAASVIVGDCEMRSFSFPLWFWLPLRLYTGLFRPKRVKVLGQEFAGEIEEIGKDIKSFVKGDQVFGPTDIRFGAYAEYKCVPEAHALALIPHNMTYAEAAVVPTGGLNALHYLRTANIQKGEKVLINGAAGNIGSFAVQIAKYYGAEVTAVDAREKLDMLGTIGADHVIDYQTEDFTRAGKRYDVIFDAIGKASYSGCVKSLKKNGRYLLANPKFSQMLRSVWTPLISRKKVIFKFADYKTEALEFLKKLIEEGKVKSVIDKSYALEHIREAHRYVESGKKSGHVVITLGNSP